MQHMLRANKSRGFTLVEMLVVAPLMVIVIATIVGFMLALIGNVLIANQRSQAQYDLQDTLSQIESDAYVSTSFLTTLSPPAPQGEDNGTAAFSSSTSDLIFNQYATTGNPADPSTPRTLVYYADAMPCTADVIYKPILKIQAVYYLKTEPDSSKSLYRRSIVPVTNQNTTIDANTTCTKPWQRGSCATINTSYPTICLTKDAKLLTNVASMNVTYFNKVAPSTVIPLGSSNTADSLRVDITVTKTIAGSPISQTAYLTATRVNSQ